MNIFGFGSKPSTLVPAGQPRRIRVLVIDDNDQFRELIRALLAPDRFEVVAINSPVKALELFSRDKHGFDLVLLDYFMPRLDGAETFVWLRKLNPNVKVIICSGADEPQLSQLVTESGMNGFIRKPFQIKAIVDLINKVIGVSPASV